jgi:hypothetical protein
MRKAFFDARHSAFRKIKNPADAGFFHGCVKILQLYDIGRGRSLGAVDDVEPHPITFGQAFKPFGVNSGMMDKNIFAAIICDKSETL